MLAVRVKQLLNVDCSEINVPTDNQLQEGTGCVAFLLIKPLKTLCAMPQCVRACASSFCLHVCCVFKVNEANEAG